MLTTLEIVEILLHYDTDTPEEKKIGLDANQCNIRSNKVIEMKGI